MFMPCVSIVESAPCRTDYFHRYEKRPKIVWSIIHKIKQNTSCVHRSYQTCNMERAAIAAEKPTCPTEDYLLDNYDQNRMFKHI